MIAVRRWVELSKMAESALKRGDLKTIELINQDEELRSSNSQFVICEGKLCLGFLDQIEAEKQPVESTEGKEIK